MWVHTAYPEVLFLYRVLAVQSRNGSPDGGDFVHAGDRLERQDVNARPVVRGGCEGCEAVEVEGFEGYRCKVWIGARVLGVGVREI